MPPLLGSEVAIKTRDLVVPRVNLVRVSNRLVGLVTLIDADVSRLPNDDTCRQPQNSQNRHSDENPFDHLSSARLLAAPSFVKIPVDRDIQGVEDSQSLKKYF